MLIDHIAWGFVSNLSWQGQLMHFIGRITGPVMAFFVAEGFMHTRDMKKYLLRMGLFALVSAVPFMLYFRIRGNSGMIFTLFSGSSGLLL